MGPSSVDVSCTDNEEEKKERAGPSRPVRCGMVLLCADHRRIPNLLPEDHCLRDWPKLHWEGYRMRCIMAKNIQPYGKERKLSSWLQRGCCPLLLVPPERRQRSLRLALWITDLVNKERALWKST
ncbi:uncharacterized protein WM294_006747 [Sarcoramphus papa]